MPNQMPAAPQSVATSRLSRRRAVAGGMTATMLAMLATSGDVLAQAGTPSPSGASYLVVRTYQLAADASADELVPLIQDGFVPIIRDIPGFIAYYLVVNRETGALATVSIFTDQGSAEASTEAAAGWIAEHVVGFYEGPPTVVAGEVGIAELA